VIGRGGRKIAGNLARWTPSPAQSGELEDRKVIRNEHSSRASGAASSLCALKGAEGRSVPAAGIGVAVTALLFLAGCAVGPDFARPAAPAVERYTPDPLPGQTAAAPGLGGAAQRLVAGRDIPGEWWTLFRSEPLNALIAEALRASPTLASAEAALRQAHELALAGQGAFFPTVQANLGASRNKTAASLSPTPASTTPSSAFPMCPMCSAAHGVRSRRSPPRKRHSASSSRRRT
jgi:hypothetical protein